MSWVYHDTNRLGSMTQSEMEQNVDEIYAQLYSAYGWSINAICGVLGNIQQESSINPAQTQNGYPIGTMNGGYGLCQWTPASKIKNWLQAHNHSLYSGYWQICAMNNLSLDIQLTNEEVLAHYGNEWIPTTQYPLTYEEFKHSGQTVEYLTMAFLKNYERAGDEVTSQRIRYAENWYRYLMGSDPPPQPTPDPPVPPDPPVSPEPDPNGYQSFTKDYIFLRNRNLIF